jgi:hypothetical protein
MILLQTLQTASFLATIMAHLSDPDNSLLQLTLVVKLSHTGTNGLTPLGCAALSNTEFLRV